MILSYCHYSINDSTLDDLMPYLKSKGIGVISASPLAMGLLTESGPPEWHPASAELKVGVNNLFINPAFNVILVMRNSTIVGLFYISIVRMPSCCCLL